MAETQPYPLQALCYTFGELREDIGDRVCGEGVVDVYNGDLLVASSGAADHSVTIAAGAAYVFNDDASGLRQMYEVRNDASVTVQLPAGGGGNPRVDTIIATVRDSEYGGTDDDWVLDSVDGTVSAAAALTDAGIAASAATVPDNSVVLAYVLVAGADTLTTTISGANVMDARNSYLKCGAAPYVELVATAATGPLTTNTVTKVTLATTVHCDRDYFSVASSVVTIKQPGLYDISGYAGIGGTSFTWGIVLLGLNGTTAAVAQTAAAPGGGTLTYRATPSVMSYNIGGTTNTIQLNVLATHTGTVNTEHDAGTLRISRLVIRKVG